VNKKSLETTLWSRRRVRHLQEMAGTIGKLGGEAVIMSMGSTGPPLVEAPAVICDYIVCDGAQVTRPSIDPYREPIETEVFLCTNRMRLSIPMILTQSSGMPNTLRTAFVKAAYNLGLLVDLGPNTLPPEARGYEERVLIDARNVHGLEGFAGLVADVSSLNEGGDRLRLLKHEFGIPLFVRLPPVDDTSTILEAADFGADAVIIDEDVPVEGENLPLEVAVSEADRALKRRKVDGEPVRSRLSLIAASSRVRGADDIFKLMGLGADCVGLSEAALIAIGCVGGILPKLSAEILQERLENFMLAVQKELKLLAGAAGVSCIYTSLVGNRELFRAIGLDSRLRKRLDVKVAGVG